MSDLSSFMQQFGAVDNDPALNEDMGAQGNQPDALAGFLTEFGGMTEGFWFYDHTIEVRFDKEAHLYFRVDSDLGNLIPLKNVSTVCHIIDKSMALVPWSAKMMYEKMMRTMPTYIDANGTVMTVSMTLVEFEKIVAEAKSAHKDKLEDAGDVGSMAHACIEESIRQALANDPDNIVRALAYTCKDERATNCSNAAFKWMSAHNVRWVCTEKKCFSKKHDCSGTMDGKAYVDSCSDPTCCPTPFKDKLSIIDWKSSNYLYIEYLFQTAAYEAFDEEEFGEDVQDRWILRLGKEDGEFDPWHLTEEDFKEDWEGFLACLVLTRLVDSVNERMKGQKMLIKARKKEAKAAAREIAKAAAKAERARERAEKKLKRAEESKRIKEEAKIARAAAKKAKLEGAAVSTPEPAASTVEVLPVRETVRDEPPQVAAAPVAAIHVPVVVDEVPKHSPQTSELERAPDSGNKLRIPVEDTATNFKQFVIAEG